MQHSGVPRRVLPGLVRINRVRRAAEVAERNGIDAIVNTVFIEETRGAGLPLVGILASTRFKRFRHKARVQLGRQVSIGHNPMGLLG